MRVLAIGDIHAKPNIVSEAIKRLAEYDKIVFLGDYCDDWESCHGSALKVAQGSIETLRTIQKLEREHPDKIIPLLGNHDYQYFTRYRYSGYSELTKTLLGADPWLMGWMGNLELVVRIDEVAYSHAGLTEEWLEYVKKKKKKLDLAQMFSPIWARPESLVPYFVNQPTYVKGKQVFGHTPVKTCTEVAPEQWCVDTFSTKPDGERIGDCSVLEIIDGEPNIISDFVTL